MNNESADEPPLSNRLRTWARSKAHASSLNPFGADDAKAGATLASSPDDQPNPNHNGTTAQQELANATAHGSNGHIKGDSSLHEKNANGHVADPANTNGSPPTATSLDTENEGTEPAAMTPGAKPGPVKKLWNDIKMIIMYNPWINWLLIFVPVGIAVGAMEKAKPDNPPVSPSVVFAMNAVAIIPLAGLLAFATESVASKLGDTIGALLNVTFGNAVELIIFIIALVANEIRIVQAALLGSILANLLLILGMCFLFGGLRFREQLYNPTVGQMSAGLLSLSVISLLLPTAFHYSFNEASQTKADRVVVKVSRGTSVVLLLVYVLYLLFQLKSHAYMYESTPQHLIDEESHPGVLAEFLDSSTSSSDTSSSSSDDSDSSGNSRGTAKRIKRAFRRNRRKSSASSKDTQSVPSMIRTPSSLTGHVLEEGAIAMSPMDLNEKSNPLEPVMSGDEADGEARQSRRRATSFGVTSRDFQNGKGGSDGSDKSPEKKKKKKRGKRHRSSKKNKETEEDGNPDQANGSAEPQPRTPVAETHTQGPDRRVDFATQPPQEIGVENSPRKPFNLLSLPRPALPKVLSTAVFSQAPAAPSNAQTLPPRAASTERSGSALRRTNSLPDRLNRPAATNRPAITSKPSTLIPAYAQPLPHLTPVPSKKIAPEEAGDIKDHLTNTSAVVLLVVSTALVAACAEFLVDSIDSLVETTHVSQAFIGLIILPIVGNAAEHVTAVTVASKNKMDLAIGVALGSSIQIALFVTPIIVLLGWCLDTEMSLYFSLFETASLFASAFIVNYLMIDGRSNYLEGALLIAAYVIIAVAAFFYPKCSDASDAAGLTDSSGSC